MLTAKGSRDRDSVSGSVFSGAGMHVTISGKLAASLDLAARGHFHSAFAPPSPPWPYFGSRCGCSSKHRDGAWTVLALALPTRAASRPQGLSRVPERWLDSSRASREWRSSRKAP